MKLSDKKSIGTIICALMFALNIQAQFITLPDPAFANFIATTYPSAVNASKQLDTNIAKTITGNFVCKSKSIINATGLEYFIGLSKIDLTSNNLTTIPDISKTTNLQTLILDSNKITSLPPINGLSNLQTFYCRINKLTSIPSLLGMSNLISFLCNGNQITTFPDLTGCSSLNHLIVSDNKITSIPDLSTLVSLNRFLLTNNLITQADLGMVPSLQQVSFKYNRLTSFPNISGLTSLNQIWVQQNYIDSIPDLSSFTSLSDLEVFDNKLTFEDLIPLTTHPHFSSFLISPQKQVGIQDTIQLKTGDTLTITSSTDTSISSDTYYWYKDSALLTSGNLRTFNIDSLSLNDNGTYSYQIKNSNPGLSNLTLYSYPIIVSVISCFDASQLEVSVNNSVCKQSATIAINESTLYGGFAPYKYTLTNSVTGNSFTADTSIFAIPGEGIYDIQIQDNLNCKVELKNKISVSRSQDCEPIFYPDLGGPDSKYYIENAGTARIYNKEGTLIRELQTPAFWDGKNKQGETMDSGVYMIIVNENIRIQISLMRTN